MFSSERDNDKLIMVDDALGIDVNVFQVPAYNIVVRHDSQLCFYLVQLQMCYMSKLRCIRVAIFVDKDLWTVDDFMFQDLNYCLL